MPPRNQTEEKNLFERLSARKIRFFLVFFLVFILTYGILFAIDFIPEAPEEDKVSEMNLQVEPEALIAEAVTDLYPQKMFIDALDREIVIQNPESREIEDLDHALLSGVVRHPDSADLADSGNMFIFGHSSYLPNVMNKNFQAFNDIQKLVWGDVIRIQSSDTEYRYRVTKIYKTKAGEATVTLEHDSAKLTLVTCNSFGSKDERFVVEAELIATKAL